MTISRRAKSIAFCLLTLIAPASAKAEISNQFVPISSDLTLHYETTGSGSTAVVFVPGWTMSTAVYEHQMKHLEDSTRWRAVTYDPRAQGLSSLTIEGHNYEQHARDLDALITRLGLSRVVLVGWSAGGGDVLEYIRLFGASKVAGLILLDTSPKSRTLDFTKDWAWFGTKDLGDQDGFLKAFSYDVMIDRQKVNTDFAKWMLDDPDPSKINFVLNITNHTPSSIAALLNTSYWYLDNTDVVKGLDGKIPLLYFTREEWNGLATQWAQANTPHAQVVSFGKHLSFWEHPEHFNAALDRFLDTVK